MESLGEKRASCQENLSPIGGSDRFGYFISIQVRNEQSTPNFLVALVGYKGKNWVRLGQLISTLVEGRQSNQRISPRIVPSPHYREAALGQNNIYNNEQSYLQVLRYQECRTDGGISDNRLNLLDRENLLKRIEMLEKEMVEIRWELLPAAARKRVQAVLQNPNMVTLVTKEGRQIAVNPNTENNLSDEAVSRNGNASTTDARSDVNHLVGCSRFNDTDIVRVVDDCIHTMVEAKLRDTDLSRVLNDTDNMRTIKELCVHTVKDIYTGFFSSCRGRHGN